MVKSANKLSPKVILVASLGIVIPLFILTMAYVAVKSDAKNQAEYQRIKEKQQQLIQEKMAAEKRLAEQKASGAVER
ncbi:hypothetical protein B9T36_02555 [Acinetobacter sp. ANC 4204]|uniref:hypothetical protein n=1 Tax=unclassified Acinetobacter TaxID=196816 RepID=UPI000A33B8FC|nr:MULTISPECIES: hypothetical protein [unclassified Acinetobacter]OTG61296.1 hypothetical protein B9T36_02555 [Acinetobacter sp. ANC 4204]RGD93762.1 hypothetical protein DYI96_02785 [Acinetobacter sp. SWAC57]